MSGATASSDLPDLPLPILRKGEDYEWSVRAARIPDFDFDEFRWDHLRARSTDESMTETRILRVR